MMGDEYGNMAEKPLAEQPGSEECAPSEVLYDAFRQEIGLNGESDARGVKALGHVALKVRNLDKSVPFYRDILGFAEVARQGTNIVYLSTGDDHHDLALMEIGYYRLPAAKSRVVGLHHMALKVGDSPDELLAVMERLKKHNVSIHGMADHKVSQSIYVTDPDGMQLELYVDADPQVWRDDPKAVTSLEPLLL